MTNTPDRTVWFCPAEAWRAGALGVVVEVAVELLVLVVEVGLAGGGQFATNGGGAVAPGQGLSWPNI